jgi:O-antigen/teichoic acid export membrane protein
VTATPLGQLGRGFATLGIADVAARLVAFAATAYVSQVIGPSQFGIIAFALAALLYAQRVVTWELEATGVVEVADDGPESERAAGTLLVARLTSAAVVLVILAAMARWVLPRPDGSVLLLYAVGLVFVALNGRFVYLMRQAPARPAVSRLIVEGVSATVVVSLVHSAADLHRVPLGFILGEAAAAAFLLSGLRVWAGMRQFDGAYAMRTAVNASPLVLSALLALVVFNLDLILLRFTWGAETAGYYAAAYAIASLILNLGVTFYSNVLPGLSRLREDRGAFRVLYADASVLSFVFFAPMVVGAALLARPLTRMAFGDGYAPSAAPLVPLVIASGLTIARFVPLASIVALGRPREALWINGSGAAVNALLNVILIPRYGLMGAASATVVTDVVRLVVARRLSRRSGVPHDHHARFLRPGLAVVVMALVVWLARDRNVLVTVPLGAVVYLAALGALGVIRVRRGLNVELKA